MSETYLGYNLIQSTISINNSEYLLVSTAHRRSSTYEQTRYFETLIWRAPNHKPRAEGKIIHSEDSGSRIERAIERHHRIVSVLARRYARRKERLAEVGRIWE